MNRSMWVGLSAGAVLGLATPSAAFAAKVELRDDLIYRAGAGETSRLTVEPAAGPTQGFYVRFKEYSAPLQAGPGCLAGAVILCGNSLPVDVEVRLGDLDDVASVVPFFVDARVYGGAGNDALNVNGQRTFASGGAGDDVIRMSTNAGSVADGGPGDDQIAGSRSDGATEFDGGAGNDLILGNSGYFNGDRGGDGNDVVLGGYGGNGGTMPAGTLEGNGGNDVLAFLDPGTDAKGWTFDGGAGDDILVGPAKVVNAGANNDEIDVTGGATPSTVNCGGGFDEVWADADDVVAANCELVFDEAAPAFPEVEEARARASSIPVPNPVP